MTCFDTLQIKTNGNGNGNDEESECDVVHESKIEKKRKMICLLYSICYKMFQAEIFFFPTALYMASDPYRAEWERYIFGLLRYTGTRYCGPTIRNPIGPQCVSGS